MSRNDLKRYLGGLLQAGIRPEPSSRPVTNPTSVDSAEQWVDSTTMGLHKRSRSQSPMDFEGNRNQSPMDVDEGNRNQSPMDVDEGSRGQSQTVTDDESPLGEGGAEVEAGERQNSCRRSLTRLMYEPQRGQFREWRCRPLSRGQSIALEVGLGCQPRTEDHHLPYLPACD